MKFGVTTYIWGAEFTESLWPLLPRLKAGGFDGLEIPIFRPRGFNGTAVRRAFEQASLAVNVSAALVDNLSLISDDADVRRRCRSHIEDIIRMAAEVGATSVAGPLYSPVGFFTGCRRTATEWARAIEAYQAIGETLDANQITLAIEPLNRFETYFLNTAADAAALCDAVGHPRVGVLFDTFHANIEEKSVAGALRTVGRHVKYVHTCENDRGTPGTGHVDWPGVFATLREIGYDGWLTIESFGFSLGDLSAAASIWRDIERDPESIAYDGVKFLRAKTGH